MSTRTLLTILCAIVLVSGLVDAHLPAGSVVRLTPTFAPYGSPVVPKVKPQAAQPVIQPAVCV